MAVLLAIWVLILGLVIRKLARFLRIYYNARHFGCEPCRSLAPRDTKRVILESLRLQRPVTSTNPRVVDAHRQFREVGSNTYSRDEGAQKAFVTADADNIKALLGSKSDYGVEPIRAHAMGPLLGKGLLTTDGAIWKRSRTIIKPSLSSANVKDVAKLKLHFDRLIELIPRDGSSVDIQTLLFQLFADSSQNFILGRSSGAFLRDDQYLSSTYVPAFRQAVRNMSTRLHASWLELHWPDRSQSRNNQLLHGIVDELVEAQLLELSKRDMDREFKDESNRAKTMLEVVSSLTQDRLEIRNQIMQGILASQDTIATFASNLLFLMARNPAVWQQLRTQLLRIVDSPNLSDDLRKITLLQNVLFESISRVALRDTTLPVGGGVDGSSKVFVLAGSRVVPYFYVLHRNPELFGEDPESFDPDRWNRVPNIHANYMAFGYGPRNCLGQDKSLYEGSYMLWRLAHAFRTISPGDERDWDGVQFLTCQNKHGCHLVFRD